VQAPKEQKSKEQKAIAAANSSKGKKKVNNNFALLWKLDCGLIECKTKFSLSGHQT
jgi:hypothetical protein